MKRTLVWYQKLQTTPLLCSGWTGKQVGHSKLQKEKNLFRYTFPPCSVWTRTLVGYPKLQRASLLHTFPLLSYYSYGLLHLHVAVIAVVFANNLHCCVDLSQHCPLRGVPVCHITLETASALMSFNTNAAVSMLECTSLFLWNRMCVTASRLCAINVTSLVFVMLY
jgi:hypothetical protein